jgi:DNA polymerase
MDVDQWSVEWKNQMLAELYAQWQQCEECLLHEERRNIVFGAGNPDADVMIVGEAPGAHEDEKGWPFIGDAGELLQSMISGVGLDWQDLYVTNVVACRPPNNRDPTAKEKVACSPRLHEIIYIVDPLIIISVGKFALNALVGGRSRSIEAEQGNLFSSPSPSYHVAGERSGAEIPGRVFPMKGSDGVHRLEYEVIPIYHTSYILRIDSYDPKTETFAAGGVFDQTMSTLASAVDKLHQLKRRHAKFSNILERMRDAS